MDVPPSVSSFVDELSPSQDPVGIVPVVELYELYAQHCLEVERPATAKRGFSRYFVEELSFDVHRADRTPDGYDRQVRCFVGLNVDQEAFPPDHAVIRTCWVSTGDPGEYELEEPPRTAVHVADSGRLSILVKDWRPPLNLPSILDVFNTSVDSIHPVPTYLREGDGLDPQDYSLVKD